LFKGPKSAPIYTGVTQIPIRLFSVFQSEENARLTLGIVGRCHMLPVRVDELEPILTAHMRPEADIATVSTLTRAIFPR
jgi:hypothetical protein